MRRSRLITFLVAAATVLGLGSAGVFASGTSATYTNHAIAASWYVGNGDHAAKPGQVGSWEWFTRGRTASWQFHVAALAASANKTVMLNINGLSTNALLGSGFSTTLRVVVSGSGSAEFTTTLANPWRPHVARNATAGVGWQASACIAIPRYVYAGAHTLNVQITPRTPGNLVGLNQTATLIGYATTL